MGLCSDWTTAASVLARPDMDKVSPDTIPGAITEASELLFWLSGRQFTGACTRTVRPNARPAGSTEEQWLHRLGAWGFPGMYSGTWGICVGIHAGVDLGLGYCGNAREIDLLTTPVRNVTQVKIGGVILDPTAYHVDDDRVLVRSDGFMWPTCQIIYLPDTELGTFSVTYAYGADPPVAGQQAAITLAAELAKAHSGQPNRLPARVTSVVRQGVAKTVMDPTQFFGHGLPLTGIPEVDLFVRTVNPGGNARPALIMSPDRASLRTSGTVYPRP